jgi:hypothetical protein
MRAPQSWAQERRGKDREPERAGKTRRAGQRKPDGALRLHPMHGTLSAAVIILAYAVVAIAAGYTAVKVIRGGPHDG